MFVELVLAVFCGLLLLALLPSLLWLVGRLIIIALVTAWFFGPALLVVYVFGDLLHILDGNSGWSVVFGLLLPMLGSTVSLFYFAHRFNWEA